VKHRPVPPASRNTASKKTADHQRQLVELWLQRPKAERTVDDILQFYGWLSEHKPDLIPSGSGAVRQLREIVATHIVEPAP
jgi:hypothetical protein